MAQGQRVQVGDVVGAHDESRFRDVVAALPLLGHDGVERGADEGGRREVAGAQSGGFGHERSPSGPGCSARRLPRGRSACP
ncbi:hypothetical protein ACFFX0_01250 [Citricoccus parietis]|uniref:Uncharacterized protein n=1 Tax=Citricoccus parietis TaxID=592307 RepID=A0ABV5FT75_9MICC